MLSNPVNYITELQTCKCSIWVRRLISPGPSHSQRREKISSKRQFVCSRHVPSANCSLEEFLPFCCLVGSCGCQSPQQIALWAAWRQAENKPLARAGAVSKDSFENVSGLRSSPSFLRELDRWGSQNSRTQKKCSGLRENICRNSSAETAEIPVQTIPSASFWVG